MFNRRLVWVALPLVLLTGLIYVFMVTDPLAPLGVNVPPVEQLTVERTILNDDGVTLTVRANGSHPISIAQVMVDEAYWEFEQDPAGPIPRLGTAEVHIPYPWVRGELHEITFITSNGVTFTHTIEVALPTPQWSWGQMLAYGLLGLYIGVIPVALGLLFYPYLKDLPERGMQFILALTVGLLVYLFIDTLQEGMELAEQAAGVFQGTAMVWLAALLSFLGIFGVGRWSGSAPRGLALAVYLSIGIGLHNLGEGMAVGAAFTSGEVALGTFLVIGFVLHNVTEGIGIAAPLVDKTPSLWAFAGLTLLAGFPAVLGTWVGTFAYTPHWAALLLAIGAGAILQVVVEVSAYLARDAENATAVLFSGPSLTGFTAGVAVMYATALMVAA